MERQIEVNVSDFDLRYEKYRIKNGSTEDKLLLSIVKNGIRDPLRAVEAKSVKILLDGFKRLRCAKKLNIAIVPYVCIGDDEAIGILKLIRGSFSVGLEIIEQAKLIDELKKRHGLSLTEIAEQLERSKAWVGLRAKMIKEISPYVAKSILAGKFSARSYLYTIAPLTRVNHLKAEEVDRFVKMVAGKKISTRDMDLLARAYFTGSKEIADQLENGNLKWSLERLKVNQDTQGGETTQLEGRVLSHLEFTLNHMQKLTIESSDKRLKSKAFFAQASVLAEGISNQMKHFIYAIGRFYDSSG